jgi:lipoprotein-anchoring transpeptidase ErfK/SrfK
LARIVKKTVAKLSAPDTIIEIFRDRYELVMWRKTSKGHYVKSKYMVAIGKVGDETPAGAYFVDARNRKPDWRVPPHKDYPPEVWGTIVPFEAPNNPFAGGFISISGGEGVGIHGTKFDPKLGTSASHGCIRMAVADLNKIWSRITIGTPVIIH